MKKLFTLFLCLIYTFVAFGGSIFMHNCGENTTLSMYEKSTHEKCPMCATGHKEIKIEKVCKSGSCQDIEIKIDQLSDKLFSSNKSEKLLLQPIIFQRLWIDISPLSTAILSEVPIPKDNLHYANVTLPYYLLNCNFRN